MTDYKEIIAVDFDGELVENGFPEIGEINEYVLEKMKQKKKEGAKIIIWTCRREHSEPGDEMKNFLLENDIPFDYINRNVPYLDFITSNKIFANQYWDDRGRDLLYEKELISRLHEIRDSLLMKGVEKEVDDLMGLINDIKNYEM